MKRTFTEATPVVSVKEHADGDLFIEGYCARYDNYGLDRDGEAYLPGSWTHAIDDFMRRGSTPLTYAHKPSLVLGKVLSLKQTEDGVRFTGRIDGALRHHPVLRVIYAQILRGTLASTSASAFFKRVMTAAGPRISGLDLVDVSITACPAGRGTDFRVVGGIEGKALADIEADLMVMQCAYVEAARTALDLVALRLDVYELNRRA